MGSCFRITHFYHSGFAVAWEDLLFVFDYWRGEEEDLPDDRQINASFLRPFRHIYVMISHEHMDHLDPIVYTWKNVAPVSYFVSSDMPVGTRGKRMAPGDELSLEEGVTLKAFDSTDLGVSFLLNLRGVTFFHAGDLNFWHWREESTLREIEEAELEYQHAVEPLKREKIDVAFFPVDPRQGHMFEAGANYFILSIKPRLLIPMHYFHRSDIIREYARLASCRSTEVIAMTGYGDTIDLDVDEGGYMNISFPRTEDIFLSESPEEENLSLEEMLDENPFLETDLPLSQLADQPGGQKNPETEDGEDRENREDQPEGKERDREEAGPVKAGTESTASETVVTEENNSGEKAPGAELNAGTEKDSTENG